MSKYADREFVRLEVRRLHRRLWTVFPETENEEKRDTINSVFAEIEAFLNAMDVAFEHRPTPLTEKAVADRFEEILQTVGWRDFDKTKEKLNELKHDLLRQQDPSNYAIPTRVTMWWNALPRFQQAMLQVGGILLFILFFGAQLYAPIATGAFTSGTALTWDTDCSLTIHSDTASYTCNNIDDTINLPTTPDTVYHDDVKIVVTHTDPVYGTVYHRHPHWTPTPSLSILTDLPGYLNLNLPTFSSPLQ